MNKLNLKKLSFIFFLFCLAIYKSSAFATEASNTHTFVYESSEMTITKIVCSNYGEDAAFGFFTFYNSKGKKKYAIRRPVGNRKVFSFSTNDLMSNPYFTGADAQKGGVLEIVFDEDEGLDVRCTSTILHPNSSFPQRGEDIKTKESYISINKDLMSNMSYILPTIEIGNFSDKSNFFKIFTYDNEGNFLGQYSLNIAAKGKGSVTINSKKYQTVHIVPEGEDVKYVAYAKSTDSNYYKSKEAFEEGSLLPAKGNLFLTNAYFTPAMFTYKIYEGDNIKYRGHMYVRPYAQKVVELEKYTKDLTTPTIKLESIEAYIPIKCPEDAQVCPKEGANEKDLYLLGEIVDTNKKEYGAKENNLLQGNIFEIPFAKFSYPYIEKEAYLNIYQESDGEGEIKLISRKTGNEKLYKVNGKEELKIKLSEISFLKNEKSNQNIPLNEDSIQIISPNKISVIFEDEYNTLEYTPIFIEEEIKGRAGPILATEGTPEDCGKSIPDNDPYVPSNSDNYEKNPDLPPTNDDCENICQEVCFSNNVCGYGVCRESEICEQSFYDAKTQNVKGVCLGSPYIIVCSHSYKSGSVTSTVRKDDFNYCGGPSNPNCYDFMYDAGIPCRKVYIKNGGVTADFIKLNSHANLLYLDEEKKEAIKRSCRNCEGEGCYDKCLRKVYDGMINEINEKIKSKNYPVKIEGLDSRCSNMTEIDDNIKRKYCNARLSMLKNEDRGAKISGLEKKIKENLGIDVKVANKWGSFLGISEDDGDVYIYFVKNGDNGDIFYDNILIRDGVTNRH